MVASVAAQRVAARELTPEAEALHEAAAAAVAAAQLAHRRASGRFSFRPDRPMSLEEMLAIEYGVRAPSEFGELLISASDAAAAVGQTPANFHVTSKRYALFRLRTPSNTVFYLRPEILTLLVRLRGDRYINRQQLVALLGGPPDSEVGEMIREGVIPVEGTHPYRIPLESVLEHLDEWRNWLVTPETAASLARVTNEEMLSLLRDGQVPAVSKSPWLARRRDVQLFAVRRELERSEHYTIVQAAFVLGVPERRIRELLETGQLHASDEAAAGPRRWLIPRGEVQALAASLGIAATRYVTTAQVAESSGLSVADVLDGVAVGALPLREIEGILWHDPKDVAAFKAAVHPEEGQLLSLKAVREVLGLASLEAVQQLVDSGRLSARLSARVSAFTGVSYFAREDVEALREELGREMRDLLRAVELAPLGSRERRAIEGLLRKRYPIVAAVPAASEGEAVTGEVGTDDPSDGAAAEAQPGGLGASGATPASTIRLANYGATMDVREVAAVLGMGEEHVRRLARRGELIGVSYGGRNGWRFERTYIEAIAAGDAQPAAPAPPPAAAVPTTALLRWTGLTVAEAAARLGFSEEHVRRMARTGALPGVNLGGRRGWRFDEDLIDAIASGKRQDIARHIVG